MVVIILSSWVHWNISTFFSDSRLSGISRRPGHEARWSYRLFVFSSADEIHEVSLSGLLSYTRAFSHSSDFS